MHEQRLSYYPRIIFVNSDPLHMLMQKNTKINKILYIQHLDQYLQWLSEYNYNYADKF